jgi:uncharacterized protein (DUF433 family)
MTSPLLPFGYIRSREPFIRAIRRIIVIDPFVAFGHATISGAGVVTSIVAERYKAGEAKTTW